MVSYASKDNQGTGYRVCADTYCQRPFFVTEDVRQKYCNKSCAKRAKKRRNESRANNQVEWLFPSINKQQKEIIMHNESAMFKEGYTAPTKTSVRPNSALSTLEENLAWFTRRLEDGVVEVERQMDEMRKKLDENLETGRKIRDIREAIALIERNI